MFESTGGGDDEDDANEEELDGTETLAMFDEESDYPSSRSSTPDPIKLDPSLPLDLLSPPPEVMISSSSRGRRQLIDNNLHLEKRRFNSPTQLETQQGLSSADPVIRSFKKQRKNTDSE